MYKHIALIRQVTCGRNSSIILKHIENQRVPGVYLKNQNPVIIDYQALIKICQFIFNGTF